MDHVVQKAQLLPLSTYLDVLERSFADLAFEILPNVGVDNWGLLAVTFTFKPLFQAAQSDVA